MKEKPLTMSAAAVEPAGFRLLFVHAAERLELQVSYAIGVSKPLSVYFDLHGTVDEYHSRVWEQEIDACLAQEPDELFERKARQPGRLSHRHLARFEQVESQGTVNPVREQTLIERHGQNRRTAMLRDDGQPALFGVAKEIPRTLAQVPDGENVERLHGGPSLCPQIVAHFIRSGRGDGDEGCVPSAKLSPASGNGRIPRTVLQCEC